MKRREFIQSSALGAVTTTALFSESGYAGPALNEEILVYIFLRGGIDGLNVIVPLDDKDHEYYSIMRPNLAIPGSGDGGALPIASEP